MTATLQMLLDEGIGLYVRCRCGHSDVLEAKTLAAVLGPETAIPDMPSYIACPQCGHTKPEVQPDWPSKGQEMVRPVP